MWAAIVPAPVIEPRLVPGRQGIGTQECPALFWRLQLVLAFTEEVRGAIEGGRGVD